MKREENNRKLCFSQADTTGKNRENAKICILVNTATSVLCKNKLLLVASCALRLSEKYSQFLLKTVPNKPFYLKEKILKLF